MACKNIYKTAADTINYLGPNPGTDEGATVTFECVKTNFVPVGDNVRTCQNGEWTIGGEPECKKNNPTGNGFEENKTILVSLGPIILAFLFIMFLMVNHYSHKSKKNLKKSRKENFLRSMKQQSRSRGSVFYSSEPSQNLYGNHQSIYGYGQQLNGIHQYLNGGNQPLHRGSQSMYETKQPEYGILHGTGSLYENNQPSYGEQHLNGNKMLFSKLSLPSLPLSRHGNSIFIAGSSIRSLQ